MNLMKQAVEVSREGGCGWVALAGWFSLCPAHTLNWGLLISQMYIHHDIYDLIFKYVGTMEASEVGLRSFSPSGMETLFCAF